MTQDKQEGKAEECEIIYEMLQEKHLEQTIECIVEAFVGKEPMTKALGITPDEFRYFASIFVKKAVREGVSTVGMDKATGQVVGFCVSEDLVSEPPERMDKLHAKFCPIMAVVYELDARYKKSSQHEIRTGEILHMFLGGIKESYGNRGVVTMVTDENLKLAKLKGFSYAIAEATGLISQHILRDKLGFAEKFAVEYKSFMYKGERVFEGIAPARACILLEKKLC